MVFTVPWRRRRSPRAAKPPDPLRGRANSDRERRPHPQPCETYLTYCDANHCPRPPRKFSTSRGFSTADWPTRLAFVRIRRRPSSESVAFATASADRARACWKLCCDRARPPIGGAGAPQTEMREALSAGESCGAKQHFALGVMAVCLGCCGQGPCAARSHASVFVWFRTHRRKRGKAES